MRLSLSPDMPNPHINNRCATFYTFVRIALTAIAHIGTTKSRIATLMTFANPFLYLSQ